MRKYILVSILALALGLVVYQTETTKSIERYLIKDNNFGIAAPEQKNLEANNANSTPPAAILEIKGEVRDPEAEKLVEGMLVRVGESGRAAVMIEYVDWQSAFEKSTKADLDRIEQPPTAERFRSYIEAILSDPSGYLAKQFEQRAQRLPPAQAEKLRETAAKFNESLGGVEELIRNRLLNTTYTVKGSRVIDATMAQVYLEIVFGDDRKLTTIDLIRRDGSWRLASVEFLKAEGGKL